LMTKLHKDQRSVVRRRLIADQYEDITQYRRTEVLVDCERLRCSRPLCSSQITGGAPRRLTR
jgi:hypothetical protein